MVCSTPPGCTVAPTALPSTSTGRTRATTKRVPPSFSGLQLPAKRQRLHTATPSFTQSGPHWEAIS